MKVRLHEKTQIAGHVHAAGEIVDVPDDWQGPMRAVRKTADRVDYDAANGIDANRLLGEHEHLPLYDVIKDETKP